MTARTLVLIATALLAAGSADAAARKPKAKPAPVAAPAQHAGVIAGGPADTRNPATLTAVFEAAGAKAQTARTEAESVLVTVTSTLANFSVQYAGCDPSGKGCRAAVFDSQAAGSPSLVQLNGFNQASAMCRGYIDKSGKAHVMMSMLLYSDDTREHLVTGLAAWQGCIGEFHSFAKDPVAYLAAAP